jgi:GIY-YIG catalytic domain
MALTRSPIVTGYARMWPREIFDVKQRKGRRLFVKDHKDLRRLNDPGVYILYRDDAPYYVGRATKLATRLHDHANKSTDRYFNFWNFFSVFVVPDRKHIAEVEGILIASMTTANRAVPRIKRIELPKDLVKILKDRRTTWLKDGKIWKE